MKTIIALFMACAGLVAQDSANRFSVPFSDPSRPGVVSGSMNNSCFTVEGYDGKDVVIETPGASGDHERRSVPRGAEGLKRIEPTGLGLTVEEDSNTVHIHSNSGRGGDLVVRVPYNTSLKLKCLNGGDITVHHVSGDLELENLNGAVTATNVSGSVLAHSLNGRVMVSLDRVTGGKPMSFSSLNGDVDVTLPGDTKGTVKMKTDNGDIYSDFEVKLSPTSSMPVVEDGRSKGGKYKVKIDKTTVGSINGGGPDLDFKTFNGNIYIRKKK
jgi:DUF4097 and DUF4098 domain-containing protein YvlB